MTAPAPAVVDMASPRPLVEAGLRAGWAEAGPGLELRRPEPGELAPWVRASATEPKAESAPKRPRCALVRLPPWGLRRPPLAFAAHVREATGEGPEPEDEGRRLGGPERWCY